MKQKRVTLRFANRLKATSPSRSPSPHLSPSQSASNLQVVRPRSVRFTSFCGKTPPQRKPSPLKFDSWRSTGSRRPGSHPQGMAWAE